MKSIIFFSFILFLFGNPTPPVDTLEMEYNSAEIVNAKETQNYVEEFGHLADEILEIRQTVNKQDVKVLFFKIVEEGVTSIKKVTYFGRCLCQVNGLKRHAWKTYLCLTCEPPQSPTPTRVPPIRM